MYKSRRISFLYSAKNLWWKRGSLNTERAKIIKSQGALAINQIHHGGCLSLRKFTVLPVLAVSAEVFNKELEKKGKLNDETRSFF